MSAQEWESYKRAIRVLQERSHRDIMGRTGYLYQAYIHAWPNDNQKYPVEDQAMISMWTQAPHLNSYFLVWHRMYLYFYERILRHAANDPHLTIPYWDYSGGGHNLVLPEVFRTPYDTGVNPLYTSDRCESVNNGKPLKAQLMDTGPILRARYFDAIPADNEMHACLSFGGVRTSRPVFGAPYTSLFSQTLHDNVHVHVGGERGLLSDACTAALDPVFMVHHSQVDRIWMSWTQLGGPNPTDTHFLDHTFTFFDEWGQPVSARIRDFLNVSHLYSYDQLMDGPQVVPTRQYPHIYIDVDIDRETAVTVNNPSVTKELEPYVMEMFTELAIGLHRDLRFIIHLQVFSETPNVFYDLYVNLPEWSPPTNQWPHYVSTQMARLGVNCSPLNQQGANDGDNRNYHYNCFDITDNLQQIMTNELYFNGFVSNQLNVTIIARDCNDNRYDANNGSQIVLNVKSLKLYHIFN